MNIKDEIGEDWVPFPGYEGVYAISNHGRVKRMAGYRAKVDRILRCSVHRGYLMATFSVNDIHDRKMVHIEVAKIFVPNPHSYPQVCHLDNDPGNPRADNLKWGTQSINIKDAHDQERMGGEKHAMSRLTVADVKRVKKMFTNGVPILEISKTFSVSDGCIRSIRDGLTWKKV